MHHTLCPRYWHARSNPAWARVSFANTTVWEVRVTNRCDCCGERLTGAQVFLGTAEGEVQCGQDIAETAACGTAVVSCGGLRAAGHQSTQPRNVATIRSNPNSGRAA